MSGGYTYIVRTADIYGNEMCATRHEAVGEAAILEGLGTDCEIKARKRYATDPV